MNQEFVSTFLSDTSQFTQTVRHFSTHTSDNAFIRTKEHLGRSHGFMWL